MDHWEGLKAVVMVESIREIGGRIVNQRANCADVNALRPLMGGHRNAPCSERFQNNTRPDPSPVSAMQRDVAV
jgi:hypothetical protein